MQHSAQDFGEEFPRSLLNATGLAFARTRHVQLSSQYGISMPCARRDRA